MKSDLKQRLLYDFKDKHLLEESLRHSSFVNEHPDPDIRDNERLEFLGDAVINLVIGHLIMQRYPDLKEGDLSKMRANLVNESQLADIARKIDLGKHIQLGKGEIHTNGRDKNSILANTFEALVAAVYLDGGFSAVFKIIEDHFSPLLVSMVTSDAYTDYKSQVQELAQVIHKEVPTYTIVHESGPDHDKTFRVELKIRALRTEGVGKSKKMAEQDAARQCLEMLNPDAP